MPVTPFTHWLITESRAHIHTKNESEIPEQQQAKQVWVKVGTHNSQWNKDLNDLTSGSSEHDQTRS